jgi:peptide/nickel transport system permease protein
MFSEIAPNLLPVLASSLLFTILYAIGAYVTLAYIGTHQHLGVELGHHAVLGPVQQRALSGEWYWFVPPGICIALVGTGLALLNFGIDEFINPRLRASGLTSKQRRKLGLPRRVRLGFTPVLRSPSPATPSRLNISSQVVSQ